MSNDRVAQDVSKAVMGVFQGLAQQGGTNLGHGMGTAGKAGEMLVSGAAIVAPVAVAKAGALTVAAIASGTAAATVAAPFALLGLVGYGVYRAVKSL